MTKMDECDLAEEAIRDLKRKICSSFVINMDRILECVNYKRSDTQSGWWDSDAVFELPYISKQFHYENCFPDLLYKRPCSQKLY